MRELEDPVEITLLLKLRRAQSKLQALALEPIIFLELHPDKEFADPDYFKRHKELTDEMDDLISQLNTQHRKRNQV